MKHARYYLLQMLMLVTAISFGQPTIDGVFDGEAVWGSPVATGDNQAGWASAYMANIYVTYQGGYCYIGLENTVVEDWQSFGIVLNTQSNSGGTQDVWTYPITYGHTELPDVVIRGHFGQGGSPYAEMYQWTSGAWQRTANDGSNSPLAATDYSCDDSDFLEFRISLAAIQNPITADIQAYTTGNVQAEHATFDAIPTDEVAMAWQDATTLSAYAADIPLGGQPIVIITPATPTDSESAVLTFRGAGTALEGATEVYLHSGVATDLGNLEAFRNVIGNWGANDGVGQMTSIGTDMWSITLGPDLLSYFLLTADDDIFQLNFLFRNGDGTLVEDSGGNNYNVAIDPGFYYSLQTPSNGTQYIPVDEDYEITANSDSMPTSWTLYTTDEQGNVLSTVATAGMTNTFSHTVNFAAPANARYQLVANFGAESKGKPFEIVAYAPPEELPRPSWTQPGINYHDDDPTKVTLVLHTPTYTRYYKYPNGTASLSGTNNTTEKDIVHVVGDFNGWQVTPSYKMYRDRDGWDPQTSSDADGDGDRGDYWWIELSGLEPGQPYIFQYLVDGVLQVADPYTTVVSDPDDPNISHQRNPEVLPYPSAAVDRASILQTNTTPYSWTAPTFVHPSINDLNIYELHFRDFTPEGTYKAAKHRLDYLEALGVNAIHVMPVSEFEGNSSWGYNPNFYFAADKYYGTADELRAFIDECHKREILVFNDLVLNHAFYSNVMARLYWNEVDNQPANDNPWFNPEHKMVAEPAGWWGADWNHESEHTVAMVDRILDYWLQEFKFDGYRFDFTKGIGQSAQDPSDPWASSYDQDRIDLLLRLVNGMQTRNPGSVAIFEHLANASEDQVLADAGILMWSGAGHHNDMKEFMLGYNGRDIYSSGIYTAQGFSFANWMSYMESHDEERQAYEIATYGNGSPNLTTAQIVDRLKIGTVFNLLFPGPRMIWQFEEVAYDVSINYNGRTGEKPVRWHYFEDADRKELWRLMSMIFHLRDSYDLFATVPDYANIGSSDPVTVPRRMSLHDGSGQHVIAVANLDPSQSHSVSPNYPTTGTWYRYNGDMLTDGTTYTVTNATDTYTLAPSESLILTSFDIGWSDMCTEAGRCCTRAEITWIGGTGDWNIASNWDLQRLPSPCDIVVVPDTGDVTLQPNMMGFAYQVIVQTGGNLEVLGELVLPVE